ncbi:MAG: hypothetical protein IJU95_09595, partial [Treponema sp.]|nr:hypothetical protein [Treponema sp.]
SACAAYSDNFAHNQEKWKNIGARNDASGELCKAAAACKNQAEAAKYLRSWLSKRFAELDKLWLK